MNSAGEFVAGDVGQFDVGVVADVAVPIRAAETGCFYFYYDALGVWCGDWEFFDGKWAVELFEVDGAHFFLFHQVI